MTDCDFLLDILKDHQWHSNAEILRYSIEERGCGLTVHSRVAELRSKRNLSIEYRRAPGVRGAAHQYRLMVRAGTGDDAAAADSSLLGPSSLSPAVQPHRSGALPVAGPTSRNDPQSERAARQLSVFEAA